MEDMTDPVPASGRPGASPGKLLRRFALLSIASVATILLLVGVGLLIIFRQQVIEDAKRNSVAVAEAIFAQEEMKLLETKPDGKYGIGVAKADFAGLDQRMRAFLRAFGIIKVKVYRDDKKIVYSTDRSIIGMVDAANASLERVLRLGEVESDLVEKDAISDLHGQERFLVDVVETYVPIRVGKAVIGGFEVYIDVTPAYERIVTAVRLSVAVLLTVLVLVFGALYVPMREGTRRLAQVQDRLRELASTDVLTGLFNRRQLFARIEEDYARIERARVRREPKESLGFIIADIDLFKKINDTHGHQAGDEVLLQVATRLKGVLRPYDVIGRYGGEEFLVMLPQTDLAGAAIVAERMRRAIAETPFVSADTKIRVTASFGVTQSHDAEVDVTAVLRRADAGLYRAKDAGRNRVVSVA